jgi:trehalose synthase
MQGFCEQVLDRLDAQLILAGPNVTAVTDDPEGARALAEAEEFWRTLDHHERARVQLACLPMHDLEENGAIVNALQRAADVVVQKSLAEGFGLTVTEAMWKGRAVVAGNVGGIPEQVTDGRDGVLVDPTDLTAYGRAVADLLAEPRRRTSLGRAARRTVRARFLHDRHLLQYADLVRELAAGEPPQERAA